MGFNQQQFKIALEEVGERLSVGGNVPGIGQPQELPLHLFATLPSTNQTLWDLLNQGASMEPL
jgi:BirA family biotin operon repressor/biotin-[acetyl-CoA-carboxylase] ligase